MKRVASAVIALAAMGSAAFGADMPVKARPLPAPVYSWTGVYVGGSVGYGWDHITATHELTNCADSPLVAFVFGGCGFGPPLGATPPGPASANGRGWFGGVQAGYNYQFGTGLVGVEFDYNWSRVRSEGSSPFTFVANAPASIASSHNVTSFGTIRGRLGWLPSETWLLYVTGGFAFAHAGQNAAFISTVTSTNTGGGFGFGCIAGQPCFQGSADRSTVGWTVGAGTEWAVSANVSLKAEYLYARFGGNSITMQAVDGLGFTPSSFQTTYDRFDLQVARIGINYHFNAPVVAK